LNFELKADVASSIQNSKLKTQNSKLIMPITESDIEKIAQLAHLEITVEERKAVTPQLASIVAYIEQLNELDTSAVEPSTGGLATEDEESNSLRDDVVLPSLGQTLALDQSPDAASGHFRVPKVL
jgi:aspartyl-tRNA(Asn)/glutamyl-tRNA(Gln) amidotransferase subunit C